MPSTSMQPIADAVDEVVVQTGSTSAEFGSYLGVHVNVVTKSGTNTPHGASRTSSRATSSTPAGSSRTGAPPRIRGAITSSPRRADGPLVIPGLYDGHNRTFFMAAYRASGRGAVGRHRHGADALMRQGNFSEVGAQIRNPLTGLHVSR